MSVPPIAFDCPSFSESQPPSTTQHGQAADCVRETRLRGTRTLSAAPRIVTTGGNSFPPETLQKPSAALAHIDWFAFTITPPDGRDLTWLFSELVKLFGITEAIPTGKGWFGYAERHDLGGYGLLAHGGESQRGSIHVELNATGCARVADWLKVMEWGETHKATITRIDLAHDDLNGQTASIFTALQWLHAGDFATNGRPPAAQLIDDLGSGKGKTLYVGNRVNGLRAELVNLEEDRRRWQGLVIVASQELNSISNKNNYDQIVRSGSAGVSESLILAKKMFDDPAYESKNATLERSARSNWDRAVAKMEETDSRISELKKQLASLDKKQLTGETPGQTGN